MQKRPPVTPEACREKAAHLPTVRRGGRALRGGACGTLIPRKEYLAQRTRPLRLPSQSLSNSLIPVLERVCASTRLTITAQYRLMPFFDGMLPATTTE